MARIRETLPDIQQMFFVKAGEKKQRQSHSKGPRKQPTKKKTKKRSRGTIRKRKRRTRKRQRGGSLIIYPDRDVLMKIACVLIYMSIDRLLQHEYADARLSFTRCIQFLESVQGTREIDVPPGNVVIPFQLKEDIKQFLTVLMEQAEITDQPGNLKILDTIQALSVQGRRRECEVCMPIQLLMLRPNQRLPVVEGTANMLYLQSMQLPENFTNISKQALQLMYGLGDTSNIIVGAGEDSEFLRQAASDLIVPITERTEVELNQLWTATFTLIMTGGVAALQGIPVSIYPPKYLSYDLSDRLGYLLFHFMSYRIGEDESMTIEGNIQKAGGIYDNYHSIVVSMNRRRPTRMLSILDKGGPESDLIDKCMKFLGKTKLIVDAGIAVINHEKFGKLDDTYQVMSCAKEILKMSRPPRPTAFAGLKFIGATRLRDSEQDPEIDLPCEVVERIFSFGTTPEETKIHGFFEGLLYFLDNICQNAQNQKYWVTPSEAEGGTEDTSEEPQPEPAATPDGG